MSDFSVFNVQEREGYFYALISDEKRCHTAKIKVFGRSVGGTREYLIDKIVAFRSYRYSKLSQDKYPEGRV